MSRILFPLKVAYGQQGPTNSCFRRLRALPPTVVLRISSLQSPNPVILPSDLSASLWGSSRRLCTRSSSCRN